MHLKKLINLWKEKTKCWKSNYSIILNNLQVQEEVALLLKISKITNKKYSIGLMGVGYQWKLITNLQGF